MDTRIKNKQQEQRQLLKAMYGLFPVGETQYDAAAVDLAQLVFGSKLHVQSVQRALIRFVELGIVSRDLVYGSRGNGREIGRHYDTTLLDEWGVAQTKLEQSFDREDRLARPPRKRVRKQPIAKVEDKPTVKRVLTETDTVVSPTARVVVASDESPEEVRAIAGPDRPAALAELRKVRKADDPEALVEAARQYADRSGKLATQIEQLKTTAAALGITLDMDQIAGSVKMERDERLESIALVLPYIVRLENTVTTQGRTIADLRSRTSGWDAMQTENRKLRDQNKRLISNAARTN